MGNKRNKKIKKIRGWKKKIGLYWKNNIKHGVSRPKKLSVLCKNVIKKYNLIESKQKFEEPSSSTIVGGKPLRDRTKTAVSSIASGSLQPPKKRKVNKDYVKLSDKKKGRPLKRLPKIEVYPRKEPFPEISVGTAEINPEPEIRIEVKLEPTAADQDPIAPDDEGFTVIVKEEFEAEETKLVAQSTGTSDTTPMQVMVPNLVCSRNVAPSSSSLPSAMSGPPLMTVVGDEMQIFANSIAEQLRAFPLDRALLLQLEIQTMIDNERQLLLH